MTKEDRARARLASDFILAEYLKARDKFPRFSSFHEGYAVLLEEVNELWEEIKSKDKTLTRLREEAIQVGAMAIAFLVDNGLISV